LETRTKIARCSPAESLARFHHHDRHTHRDYTEWKRLLKAAQLRDGRLHDARHTAATVLLILGVPERAVMGIMGWSDSGMAKRYQHLTAQIRHDIAKQVGGLLWEPDSAPPDDRDDGAAGVLAPVAYPQMKLNWDG
jgi:integrase